MTNYIASRHSSTQPTPASLNGSSIAAEKKDAPSAQKNAVSAAQDNSAALSVQKNAVSASQDNGVSAAAQKNAVSASLDNGASFSVQKNAVSKWWLACRVEDVPADGGACVSYGEEQIAIFNFTRRGQWYATQNLCPHKQQMVLSRGMIGSTGESCEPKVACPFHKRTFSLLSGECLSGDEYRLRTYPVKVKDGKVYIGF